MSGRFQRLDPEDQLEMSAADPQTETAPANQPPPQEVIPETLFLPEDFTASIRKFFEKIAYCCSYTVLPEGGLPECCALPSSCACPAFGWRTPVTSVTSVIVAVIMGYSFSKIPFYTLVPPPATNASLELYEYNNSTDPGDPLYGMEISVSLGSVCGMRGLKLYSDPRLFLGPHTALGICCFALWYLVLTGRATLARAGKYLFPTAALMAIHVTPVRDDLVFGGTLMAIGVPGTPVNTLAITTTLIGCAMGWYALRHKDEPWSARWLKWGWRLVILMYLAATCGESVSILKNISAYLKNGHFVSPVKTNPDMPHPKSGHGFYAKFHANLMGEVLVMVIFGVAVKLGLKEFFKEFHDKYQGALHEKITDLIPPEEEEAAPKAPKKRGAPLQKEAEEAVKRAAEGKFGAVEVVTRVVDTRVQGLEQAIKLFEDAQTAYIQQAQDMGVKMAKCKEQLAEIQKENEPAPGGEGTSSDALASAQTQKQVTRRFKGILEVSPQQTLLVFDALFYANYVLSWGMTYMFNYEFLLDNPVVRVFKVYNICIGTDSMPARALACLFWAHAYVFYQATIALHFIRLLLVNQEHFYLRASMLGLSSLLATAFAWTYAIPPESIVYLDFHLAGFIVGVYGYSILKGYGVLECYIHKETGPYLKYYKYAEGWSCFFLA